MCVLPGDGAWTREILVWSLEQRERGGQRRERQRQTAGWREVRQDGERWVRETDGFRVEGRERETGVWDGGLGRIRPHENRALLKGVWRSGAALSNTVRGEEEMLGPTPASSLICEGQKLTQHEWLHWFLVLPTSWRQQRLFTYYWLMTTGTMINELFVATLTYQKKLDTKSRPDSYETHEHFILYPKGQRSNCPWHGGHMLKLVTVISGSFIWWPYLKYPLSLWAQPFNTMHSISKITISRSHM